MHSLPPQLLNKYRTAIMKTNNLAIPLFFIIINMLIFP